MVKIACVTNAPPHSGMGKPARDLLAAMRSQLRFSIDDFFIDTDNNEVTLNGQRLAHHQPLPGPLNVKPVQWWRLAHRLPRRGYSLWHLTNQSLSFINRPLIIITVHDLIELIEPQERFAALAARFLYRGLPRAAHIICVSNYTKSTVQQRYGIPDARLTVIPEAVSAAFQPLPHARSSLAWQQFLWQHRLTPEHKIILYVGSEHPRKNLAVLVRAFASVRRQHPETVLLKVGEPGILSGRAALLNDLDRINLRAHTRLIARLSDEELRLLYAAVDVFVYPSAFEGFGLPPLEALACGCPVVASNATSLPEVVGAAALLCPPADHEAFADSIQKIFDNPSLAAHLRQRGPQHAARYSWQHAALLTAEVYQQVLESHSRLHARQ